MFSCLPASSGHVLISFGFQFSGLFLPPALVNPHPNYFPLEIRVNFYYDVMKYAVMKFGKIHLL